MKDFDQLIVTGKAALDEIDCYILRAWGTILECDKINMQDMFFECGGNSVLAGEFFLLLQAEYPCLTVVDLYAYSTPEGIGNCILNMLDSQSRSLDTIYDGYDVDALVSRYVSGELSMEELSALLDE